MCDSKEGKPGRLGLIYDILTQEFPILHDLYNAKTALEMLQKASSII